MNFNDEIKAKLLKDNLNAGDVFLKEFPNIPHPKFFIILGITKDKISLCSVFINSEIHHTIKNKQELLEMQIPLMNYEFLKYFSFANCSWLKFIEAENLINEIINEKCKIIGKITEEDLKILREKIINSELYTEVVKQKYFS